MLKVNIFEVQNTLNFLPLVILLRVHTFLKSKRTLSSCVWWVCLYVCPGSRLNLNAITNKRMQTQEESLRYSPYFSTNRSFQKEHFKCWYKHFDGLVILTNYSFFAVHKNQEFVIKLKHKITPKRRGKHREKSEKAKTSSKKISSDFWRRCVETKASRIFRLQSGYSVYKHIDVSYMTVWSFRKKSETEPFSFNQRW